MTDKETTFLLLCFVDSILDHRSELDQLHVGAVFLKAWCKVGFPVPHSNVILKTPVSNNFPGSQSTDLNSCIWIWGPTCPAIKKKKNPQLWKAKAHLQVSFLPLNELLHTTWRDSRASGYHNGRAWCALKVCQETKLAMSVVRWDRTMGCWSQRSPPLTPGVKTLDAAGLLTLYGLLAVLTDGNSSQKRTAAVGEHEARADYRPNAQWGRVLALYAFFKNFYYVGQELYKTKFNFKSLKFALCSQELSA